MHPLRLEVGATYQKKLEGRSAHTANRRLMHGGTHEASGKPEHKDQCYLVA